MTALVPISSVAEVNPRMPRSLADNPTQPVSFVPMAAVSEDGYIAETVERSLAEVLKGYTYFKRGDVIVAKITPCVQNGKAAYTTNLPQEVGFGSTEFHVLRPGPKVDGRYLFHMIWSPQFRRTAEHNMTGTAGQQRVPTDFFERFKIPLPPLPEQRRIAAILDKADTMRRKRQQAIRLTKAFLRSAFLDMFGDPVKNDHKLPVREMIQIVDCKRPISYGILKPGPHLGGGIPYVRVLDIQNGTVLVNQLRRTSPEIADQYRRSVIEPGDLLLSIRGHVGRVGIVPEGISGANITQDTARLAIPDPILAHYVFWCLECEYTQRWMQRHVKGVAVQGINLGDVKRVPIPIPPKQKLGHFYDIQKGALGIENRQRGSSDFGDACFASLQQRAFKGQL